VKLSSFPSAFPRVVGMAQVVEFLLSNYETLRSSPIPPKKKSPLVFPRL
jgi:hypothetical protein